MVSAARPQLAPEPAQEAGAPEAASPRRRIVRRAALGLGLLAATALAGDFGYDYWTMGRFMVSTDDAYVQADYTTVAPKVSGYIADVAVQDNEAVKAGQVLAHIDDRDFRAAQAQAKAGVDAAEAAIGNIDAETVLQQSVIEEARAAIGASQASLNFNRSDVVRYNDLAKNGYASQQRAQQSETARSQSVAELQRDQAALTAAQKKIGVLETERVKAVAERDRAQAILRQADLNLSYTTITAPVDGTVGARSLRVGAFVNAGTQLMAVVPLHAAYIVANFKETQLTRMRDGQAVTVKVDSFPGVKITGHVDSLSPASGLEFSLLPPDNATGNFTKIVQRIPVKIVLDDARLVNLLRAGMSVEPTVNTKPAEAEGKIAAQL
ncbi:MAG TPA: HlyD family secretion protein [Alphaproteobacteria bacterium]|jgi:membrane fusion protein (multidrug efflux system)|nr:HlyD family secretion protein [Alphaproteobacteria bacterium]